MSVPNPTNPRTPQIAALILAAALATGAPTAAHAEPPKGKQESKQPRQDTPRAAGEGARKSAPRAEAPARPAPKAEPRPAAPPQRARPAPAAPRPVPAPRDTARPPRQAAPPSAPPAPAPRRPRAETPAPPAARPSGDRRPPRAAEPRPAPSPAPRAAQPRTPPRPAREYPRPTTVVPLPSGVDTSRNIQPRATAPRSTGRLELPGRPSHGIPLPSGVDTARRHQNNRDTTRVPRSPGPSLRIDAPGAPARDFGTPRRPPTPAPAPRNHDPNDRRDRDDRNDRSGHDRPGHTQHNRWDDHRDFSRWRIQSWHNDRRSHFSSWNICPTPSFYSRPTNYVYSFGGGWYTDLFPAGTWGYQTSWSYPSLYAWQYDTSPIYDWTPAQTYTTSYCPDVWAWSGCLTDSTTFVTGGAWSIEQPPLLLGSGVTAIQDSVGAPVIDQQTLEHLRAETRLLSRINRAYDVAPDFGAALDGAASGDFSGAIYAMRRAAGVNPAAMVGADSRVARVMRDDRDLAQRAAYARQVFQNPPQRVVSEVDAAFMVGALSAALGEYQTAEEYLGAAQAAGDGSISTELLRRAVRGDNLDPSGPWVPGSPLRR